MLKNKFTFFKAMNIFGCSLLDVNSLKCVSMNNQECKIRPQIININSNETHFILLVLK